MRPQLQPPAELEDEAPTRFAQPVGQVFTGFALVAARLNAAVGLCLGCELYLIVKRTSTKGATA